MNGVNQIFLLGAAGKDPEIRATSGGTVIVSFSLATSEGRKDTQGNWKDEVTWHNVKAFGRVAEVAREQVQKGSRVFVQGKLTTETWDDAKSGQKRYKAVIVASHLSVVPSARSFGSSNSEATEQRAPAPRESLQRSIEITNDDIPF